MHEDVLKANVKEVIDEELAGIEDISDVITVYVTTPIILKLLEDRLPIRGIVCIPEGSRLIRWRAKPGTKEYGSLSIAIQFYTEAEVVVGRPKTRFMPQPNVDSAVIRLTKRNEPLYPVISERLLPLQEEVLFKEERRS